MINLKHYSSLLTNDSEAQLIMKFFHKKEFKNLNSAQWFFKNQTADKVAWINDMKIKEILPGLCKKFGELLDAEQLDLTTKQNLVLSKLDKDSPQLSFLEPKGSTSVTILCPKCKGVSGKSKKVERGWIPKNGTAKSVICQHRSSCGFSSDFIGAFAEEFDKSYGEALNILADELGIDFTINEIHIEGTVSKPVHKPIELVPKKVEKEDIKYMVFDKNKPYKEIDFKEFVDKYETMTELQQFKMVATAIYEFSKTTKQWQKNTYYKSVGISAKERPELLGKVKMIDSKLGCLFKTDLPDLIKYLENLFPLEDLIKFGVLNDANHKFPFSFKQSVEEALIVIPNLDLYTNMCSGLKYRKTKLKSWTDKTGDKQVDANKEPEFSYGRIANPLPYHLTRESLLNNFVSFRFLEGQKDLHSLPSKDGVCDIAIPGTNGINEEILGLFKGRIVELYFDQDIEGQKGAKKLKALLEKAGAIVVNITWDVNLGGDVNEVLQNGNIKKII